MTTDRPSQVLAAVRRVLAADALEEDRRRADAFLQAFQKMSDAIPICMAWLMHDHGRIEPHEELFFVNTIYRALCSRGSKDNPKYPSRKDDIAPISPAQLASSCFHQLCRHIYASLSQHMPMNMANQFACCVTVCVLGSTNSDVLSTLNQLASHERAASTTDANMQYCIELAIILVLHLVPEEIQNKRLLLRADHRTIWEQAVVSEAPGVLQALESCWRALSGHGLPHFLHEKMASEIFQSFGAWVEHGRLPASVVAKSNLLQACLDLSLQFSAGAHAVLVFQVIRDVIHVCVDVSHQPLMDVLVQFTIHLGPRALQDQTLDEDILLHIATTIADCGQQALLYNTFATSTEESLKSFLDVLLAFTAVDNITVSSKLLDFWIDLRTCLTQTPNDKIDRYVQQVLRILLQSTELTRSSQHSGEEFHQYRKEIRTAFRSLTQPTQAYQMAFVHDTVGLFMDEARTRCRLTKLEIYLHALSAMAKSFGDEAFVSGILEYIAHVASSIQVLEFESRAFLRMAAVFLSVLHTWAARQTESLPLIYTILSKCLECSEEDEECPMRVAEDHIAAVALVKMASNCASAMLASDLPWLQMMQAIYRTNLLTPGATMTDKSLCLVLEAYATVVAIPKHKYYQAATPAITDLCGIAFEQVDVLVPQSNLDQAQASLALILGHLQALVAALPAAADGLHPMLHVVQLNWSTIQLLFSHRASLTIQCRVSTMLATLFRIVGPDAAPLVVVAVPMFLDAFSATPARCFLDAVSASLHCASDTTPDVNHLLVLALAHVVHQIPHMPLDDLDGIGGVFDLVSLSGTRRPELLAQAQCFELIFAFATDAIARGFVDECMLRFFQAAWRWLAHSTASSALNEQVRAIVPPRMVSLLQMLVAAPGVLAATTADGAMDEIAETLLHACRTFEPSQMAHWMKLVLSDPTFPRPGVASSVKAEMVQVMSQPEAASARKIRRLLKQLCKL
ncbi:Transportin-3 [Aphanomyces cochlioides]|nr:Transportin-3 [Aphanomyces cochlioides]